MDAWWRLAGGVRLQQQLHRGGNLPHAEDEKRRIEVAGVKGCRRRQGAAARPAGLDIDGHSDVKIGDE